MNKSALCIVILMCGLGLIAGTEEISASTYCETIWGPDGLQLSETNDGYYEPKRAPYAVQDGAGGAFYLWGATQYPNDWAELETHLFMQRIDAAGLPQWTTDGIDVSLRHIISSDVISLTPDGLGGVIACWTYKQLWGSDTNYVYMQRLDANGVEQWTPGGIIAASADIYDRPYPSITSDGSGGAIMIYIQHTFNELYQQTYTQMRIQRIDEYGSKRWGDDGKNVGNSGLSSSLGYPGIISDGAGGAIYAFPGHTYPVDPGGEVHIGRKDNNGTTLWSESILQPDAESFSDLRIVDDGYGGAVISWTAYESGVPILRAKRFSADGTPLWAAIGEEIVSGTIVEGSNGMAPGGSGGAVITWTDDRLSGGPGGTGLNTFMQLLDGTGAPQLAPGGDAVCIADGDQVDPCITESADNGAIIAWTDESGGGSDIYAQLVDSLGVGQWGLCGTAVCSEVYDQNCPVIVGDDADGAIVAWMDYRFTQTEEFDVYTQRIDTDGTEQWTPGGQAVCQYYENDQQNMALASDGAEGAIVVWAENMGGIYMQRVAPLGFLQWGDNGVTICPATWKSDHPELIPDGTGGVITVWQDRRNGLWDIYTQRVDAAGSEVWSVDDVVICTASEEQLYPRLVDDGAGGAIIVWRDSRAGNLDLYAQRVDAGGLIQWDVDGVGLCTATGDQQQIQIIDDGAGGAIVVWADGRDSDSDIYAQRVDVTGTPQWTADGTPICSETGDQLDPRISSDGSGGAIIVWQDGRGDDQDIYAQRIGADGSALWAAGGIAICTAEGDQTYPRLNTDGSDGAILTWMDGRALAGLDMEFFAQSIEGDGSIRWASDGIKLFDEYFRDTSAEIVPDGSGGALIACYDWIIRAQHVDSNGACLWGAEGATVATTDTGMMTPVIAPDGVGGALLAWNSIPYSELCAASYGQRFIPRAVINVTVTTDPPGLEVVVDGEPYNSPYTLPLSPGAELEIGTISPQRDKGTDYYFVEWSDGGDTTHVVTLPDTNVTYTATFTDDITGDEVEPVPLVNALHQNHPNPFNPSTTISFSLRESGHASLAVYDIAGRLVRVLIDGVVEAGPRDVTWDGKDNAGRGVASGVYFYRLEAGEFVETKKMVLLR